MVGSYDDSFLKEVHLRIVVCICGAAAILFAGCSDRNIEFRNSSRTEDVQTLESLNPRDLMKWHLLGKGEMSIDEEENALVLTEGADSKGITVVSPKSYGRNVVVSFELKPLSYEGINFVFLSASDRVTGGELKVTGKYDGNMTFWTEGRVQNYIFAYHNGFYDSKPFIKKNPGLRDIAVAKNLVRAKGSYKIETGRKGKKLWIKVDGKTVVTGSDKDGGGLPAGRIGLRLRGPGAGSYTCLFKNVMISED